MATNQFKGLVTPLDSEATEKPQPSKNMNGGSAKIDGANPTSPSTNNATRREQYNNYIKTLDKDSLNSLYSTVKGYKNAGLSNDDIYDKVLNSANIQPVTPSTIGNEEATKKGVDLTIKGNFDLYNPIDWENQPELLQQYYVQANNDIKSSRRALSQLMLQQDALNAKSGNVEQVTTLIDAIENAYDKGIFDTQTIANTLGVSPETISLIQQGKANELITLKEDFVKDQLKSYYRKEEDYDTGLQRTMEDYQLARTNLDHQYNSAMQTLKRNLFDDKWKASVGSAVAGISGSEYAIKVIEAKHQQNMDDLDNNYLYSSTTQKYSYTRAIEDYNKNIQRLSEDFDDALKDIQASVLQQFQEIDNKIGLTTAQLAQAYGTLEKNVITAKSAATTDYLKALSDGENTLADAIANTYGLDTTNMSAHTFSNSELGRTWNAKTGKYNMSIGEAANSIGHILASNDGMRIGTYSPGNGYTYNVYATREDGVAATVGLLQRAYYGLTLEQAAQKWIGKGKNIPGAKNVMKGLGLDLNAKLSDANVEKFITAMGRWEGTLGKNETLAQWIAKGKDLSSYKQDTGGGTTTSSEGGSYYRSIDDGLYEAYANREKTLSSQESKNIKEDSYYGSNADERWNNFVAAADIYKQNQTANEVKNIQSSRDLIKDARDSFKNATEGMTDNEIRNAYSAYKEYIKKVENGEAVTIKNLAIAQYLDSNPDLLTAFAQFDQVLAQGFIDTIISSKKKGATYGPLSDNEGRSLRQAYTSVNMLQGRQNIIAGMDKMISNLDTNIKEMSPKQTTSNGGGGSSNGGGGSNNTIGLSDVINLFKNIPKSSDLIFSGSSTQNNGGGTQFDTPGGMNTTGQNNGGNGTGTFEFPRTPMK